MNREQTSIMKIGALLTGILLISWVGSFGFEWLADHLWSGFRWVGYTWSFAIIAFVVWIGWQITKPQADLWPVLIIPGIVGFVIFLAFIVVAASFDVGFVVGFAAMAITYLNTVFVVGYLEREWKL